MRDPMKLSRMEIRLRKEISVAEDSTIIGSKRAELAAYWARLGKFTEASEQLKSLRIEFQNNPNIRVSAAIHLADGLIDHFTDMRESAREKILRASALAHAGGISPIISTSAAWLAQLDYLQLNHRSMVIHLRRAFQFSTEADHAARCRAALVVAQSYHYAGDSSVARGWYAYAHSHAVADADDASISALMHNMAWLRFNELRAAVFSNCTDQCPPDLRLVEVDSIFNYDKIIGSTSLSSFVAVLRAQILTASGRYEEALVIFENDLERAVEQGMERLRADWVADEAWCLLNIGQIERARVNIQLAEKSIDATSFDDDLAFSHFRVFQVHLPIFRFDFCSSSTIKAVMSNI